MRLDHDARAAVLINLFRFIEWPEGAQTGGALILGVIGAEDFQAISRFVNGRQAGNRRVHVRAVRTVEEARACHMLYVNHSHIAKMPAMQPALDQAHVLTVGESPHFLLAGGAVNLAVTGGRARFDINRDAAARAGLKMNSHLLNLASNLKRPDRAPN